MHSYSKTQQHDFYQALSIVMQASSNPKELTQELFRFWLGLLDGYEMYEIKAALTEHARRSRFCPAPADILDLLPSRSNFLEPEEAWNHVPKSEYEGGYICEEMMQAAGTVEAALDRGDHIQARMGFIETYKKLTKEATLEGREAKYWYSGPTLGSLEMKEQIKEQAVVHAKTKKLIGLERYNKEIAAIPGKTVLSLEQLTNVTMLKSKLTDDERRKRLAEIKAKRLVD